MYKVGSNSSNAPYPAGYPAGKQSQTDKQPQKFSNPLPKPPAPSSSAVNQSSKPAESKPAAARQLSSTENSTNKNPVKTTAESVTKATQSSWTVEIVNDDPLLNQAPQLIKEYGDAEKRKVILQKMYDLYKQGPENLRAYLKQRMVEINKGLTELKQKGNQRTPEDKEMLNSLMLEYTTIKDMMAKMMSAVKK